jgi:hypothetical protein
MRLKRAFGKIDVREHGKVSLSDTTENSRDLEWFITRYPMVVEEPHVLSALASKHRDDETLLNKLLDGLTPPETFDLLLPPRDYQTMAANVWMVSQGLLLADDVGVGKTISAICGLSRGNLLPSLVTTLTHLPRQWEGEIKRFTGLNVHILKKGTPYDLRNKDGRFPDVVVANYHKLSGWSETLAPLMRSLVFDEVGELRRAESNKYAAARYLAEKILFRIGLSATPIYGYGSEIFNIINVLRPDALGTEDEFLREWCVNREGKWQIEDPVGFGLYLREAGLMLRRTAIEVGRELPPVTVVPHYIDADPKVISKMQGRAIELAKLILADDAEKFRGQKMQARGEFDMRMRQQTGIAKAPFVAEFVKLLHQESKQKIVLFGWHRECYTIWLEKLKDLNPVLYTGSESPTQKEASKKAFVEGDSQVMIISLRSGVGLDGLQHVCRIAVFGELDWAYAVHEQDIGRIARDGQLHPVVAYFLLSEYGSDPVISDIVGVKKMQLDGIRNPNDDLISKLQVEEDHIRKLAESFLKANGIELPQPAEPDDSTLSDEEHPAAAQ